MKDCNLNINFKQNGLRLDRYLSSRYDKIPIVSIQKFIKKKEITVNNKKVDFAYILKTNDVINFSKCIENILKNPDIKAENPIVNVVDNKCIELFKKSIIFENDDLIIINKPYNLAVQGGTKIDIDIASIIKAINNRENSSLRLVHRIDKTTTGILVIAKNFESANALTEMFKDKNKIQKTYLAFVDGCPQKLTGTIDFPLLKKIENNEEKVYRDDKNGKKALTEYKVIKKFDNYALLEVKIFTGRTHQIRVHLKEINHPILGDFKYNKSKNKNVSSTHLQLHAYKINFILFGNRINVVCPIPDSMQKFI